MEEVCHQFYENLYSSKKKLSQPKLSPEAVPPILLAEFEHAVTQMKNGKAEGIDGVTIEEIKTAGPKLWRTLSKLFTKYIQTSRLPSQWKTSKTVLLYKKETMKIWLTTGLYVCSLIYTNSL